MRICWLIAFVSPIMLCFLGVGKTEVCKSLAETYFGQEKDLISIDIV